MARIIYGEKLRKSKLAFLEHTLVAEINGVTVGGVGNGSGLICTSFENKLTVSYAELFRVFKATRKVLI